MLSSSVRAALLAFSVSFHRPGDLCPLTALVSEGGGLINRSLVKPFQYSTAVLPTTNRASHEIEKHFVEHLHCYNN